MTLAASVSLLAYVSVNPLPSRNSNVNATGVSCPTYGNSFLIIANEKGYNNSIDHGVPKSYWPVLCVHLGDTVRITVENSGSEPHGFAVGTYYEAGASIPQGSKITLSLTAGKPGAFLIYCTILCAIHPWMLSGLLVVK